MEILLLCSMKRNRKLCENKLWPGNISFLNKRSKNEMKSKKLFVNLFSIVIRYRSKVLFAKLCECVFRFNVYFIYLFMQQIVFRCIPDQVKLN